MIVQDMVVDDIQMIEVDHSSAFPSFSYYDGNQG